MIKISITTVIATPENISLVYHLWHSYLCFTTTTISRQQTRNVFWYRFVLEWYLYSLALRVGNN